MSEPRTIPDFVIKTIFLNISLPPLGVPDLSLLLPHDSGRRKRLLRVACGRTRRAFAGAYDRLQTWGGGERRGADAFRVTRPRQPGPRRNTTAGAGSWKAVGAQVREGRCLMVQIQRPGGAGELQAGSEGARSPPGLRELQTVLGRMRPICLPGLVVYDYFL